MGYKKKITIVAITILLFPLLISAGDLDPPLPPDSTMKTLDEIPPSWHQILPASERFVDVMGGEAVLDKETGLAWAKDANLDGDKNWKDAINYCHTLVIGNRKGWRLPTVEELSTLLDMSISSNFKVPSGIFDNIQSNRYYWSSTECVGDSALAWNVSMNYGLINRSLKPSTLWVWPVRGGMK
jgi:uncharacterized protein DUF1566